MALLNDDGKLSNPRAGPVRIAADAMSGSSGQRRHDMRILYKSAYVGSIRTSLNRVLIIEGVKFTAGVAHRDATEIRAA